MEGSFAGFCITLLDRDRNVHFDLKRLLDKLGSVVWIPLGMAFYPLPRRQSFDDGKLAFATASHRHRQRFFNKPYSAASKKPLYSAHYLPCPKIAFCGAVRGAQRQAPNLISTFGGLSLKRWSIILSAMSLLRSRKEGR